MKHIKKLRIDIDKQFFEVIPSVQYDSNTRYLHIHLLNSSVPFDITGCSVKISGTKPDGTAIFNNCTVISAKEGFIEVELTEQMNTVPGMIKCELKIYDGNGVLTTKQFSIEVTASITSKVIESSDEFKALTDTINKVQKIDNKFSDVYSRMDTKASFDYVDELVASKQLQGAGIDTSTLTMKSEFEPIKEIANSLRVFQNACSNKSSTPLKLGGEVSNYEEIEEDGYISISYNQSIVIDTCIYRNLPHKMGEIESVKIYIQFTEGDGWVGLATGFNWGTMTRASISNGSEKIVELKMTNIPTYDSQGYCGVYIGTSKTRVAFKARYEYKLKTNAIRTHANYADESVLAQKSITSENCDHAKDSTNSVYAINAGAEFIPFSNITSNRSVVEIDRSDSYRCILHKPADATIVGSNWLACYIKIPYTKLEDLDKELILNFENLGEPMGLTNYVVPYVNSDWNPVNKPIPIDITKPINLYETIMGKDETYIDKYKYNTYLCVLIGHQRDDIHTREIKWSVCPYFKTNSNVLATQITDNVKQEIINSASKEFESLINKTSIGLKRSGIEDCSVRESGGTPGLTVITAKDDRGWINVKKESTELGTKYCGVYIQYKYDKYDDLDGEMLVEYKPYGNTSTGEYHILYGETDWGLGSGNIYLPINKPFNPKELLSTNPAYQTLNSFYMTVLKYNPNGVSDTVDFDIRITFSPNNDADVRATELSKSLWNEIDQRIENNGSPENYITCWGDSLTAGGGWTQKIQELSGIPVYNGGTGGENSRTIMARQGGDIMLVNNITIPAGTTPITIATRSDDTGISTYLGHKVTPLLQGGSHINPCYIGDIKGTLSWTGSDYNDMTGTWTFTRAEVGEEIVINRPTAIRTDFDINRNRPKIMIIFIGQNGGYTDTSDLINQHRLMIEHSKAESFIVLGLSSGTASQRSGYEEAMRKEFGRRFISLREYLSTYGLADAGIEPTEQDLAMMAQGQTPQSLLSDSVHYNSECKAVIGSMIYKKIKELNMI